MIDVEEGASSPEAFNLLLHRLMTHFDHVDMGEGYTKLHSFGVCTGTPFFDFSRVFRVLVSAVTGSERTLAPWVDVVLEAVRMAVNEQFPSLMPTRYFVPWFDGDGPEAIRFVGRDVEGGLATYQLIRLLSLIHI